MLRLDYEKYGQNPDLMKILLSTGNRPLIGNNPKDQFWRGNNNWVGKFLQRLRSHFQGDQAFLPQTILIGDSMIKGICPSELSKEIGYSDQCLLLPGAKIEYVFGAVFWLTGACVKNLVIFGGTNNLSLKENGLARMGSNKLAKKVQQFDTNFRKWNQFTNVYFCQILNRSSATDRVARHISGYNEKLLRLQRS